VNGKTLLIPCTAPHDFLTGNGQPCAAKAIQGARYAADTMIDWDRIEDLRFEIGPDNFDEVVVLFLEEADEVIAGLASARVQNLAADLHFLKGSALNLGFSDLARQCQNAERRVGAGEDVDVTPLIAAYHASRAEFVESGGTRAA
jgi:histidine phosphotransfer protein HptB